MLSRIFTRGAVRTIPSRLITSAKPQLRQLHQTSFRANRSNASGIYGRLNVNNATKYLAATLASASALAYFGYSAASSFTQLDVKPILSTETVQPKTDSPPLPTEITIPDESAVYQLLGYGVRTVSFLNFHVYALGIYINKDDIARAKNILSSYKNLEEDLADVTKDGDIVSNLLKAGIRFSIRIVPVRNTDFSHLRDGFVKTILAHPLSKVLGHSEEFGNGLQQLKNALSGRKGAVPKHHVLTMDRSKNGVLRFIYYDANDESKCAKPEELGQVTEPQVSEILFLQYLSGRKPSSESAKKSSLEGLVSLSK